jgi:hypothetical protein
MARLQQKIQSALLAVIVGAFMLCAENVAWAVDAARADDLKAAYLFNFAKLVEWPASSPADTLTICFVGATGVRDAFKRAAGEKQVGTRRIVVRPMVASAPRAGCDVLYLDAALTAQHMPESALSGALTVSDAADFAAHGGMIELFAEGNRLRFNINLPSAQRAGLRISSSLLQLAAHIEKGGSR